MSMRRDRTGAGSRIWSRTLIPLMSVLAVIGTSVAVSTTPAGADTSGFAGSSVVAPSPITAQAPSAPKHFVWRVTASSKSFANSANITNPAAKNDPNALVFVTPTYDPGSKCPCHLDQTPLGVYYDTTSNRWQVFHEDKTVPMRVGSAYNVLILPHATSNAFRWTAQAGNISRNTTYLSSGVTDSRPNARILVTQVLDQSSVIYNNDDVAVGYDPSSGGRWGIFNDLRSSTMPVGAEFNVLVNGSHTGGGTALIQTTTTANTFFDATLINNPVTNGAPNAMIFATNNYDAHGVGGLHGGISNPHILGAWFIKNRWGVFNEDQAVPGIGSSMNVLMFNH